MVAVRLPITQSGNFDGVNDTIAYSGISDLDGVSAATFSVWVYQTSLDAGVVFQNRAEGTTNEGWLISLLVSGRARFEIYTTATGSRIRETTSAVMTTGAWHHICATFASGTATLYFNGALAASSLPFGSLPSAIPACGTLRVNQGDLAARLSNCAYWAGVAANASQVAEIYESGRVHDLAFLPTLGAPTRWAILDGSPDLVDGTTGTVTGGLTYISSTPPLVPASASVVHAAPAEGGWGAEAFGAVPHGTSAATTAATGTPAEAAWCTTGTGWLLSQFRKPKMEAVLCALLNRAQDLEQAIADIRDLRWLSVATGAALDVVGWALGLPRSSLPDPAIGDEAYRSALQAQAKARAASGDCDGMLRVGLDLMSGASSLSLTEHYPAEISFAATSALTYNEGKLFAKIMNAAKPAGVGFYLHYEPRDTTILAYDDDPVRTALPIPEDGATAPVLAEDEPGLGGA